MKRLAIVPILLLAACAEGEVDEPVVVEEAVMEEPAQLAFDGNPIVGTYEAVSNDGVRVIQVLAEDGTITSTFGDDEPIAGTWSSEGSDHFCWTADDETMTYCSNMEEAEGDSWLSRNADNPEEVWTVTRVE